MNQQQISPVSDGIALADVESLYGDIHIFNKSNLPLDLLNGLACVLS